jgi:hypothetical protein
MQNIQNNNNNNFGSVQIRAYDIIGDNLINPQVIADLEYRGPSGDNFTFENIDIFCPGTTTTTPAPTTTTTTTTTTQTTPCPPCPTTTTLEPCQKRTTQVPPIIEPSIPVSLESIISTNSPRNIILIDSIYPLSSDVVIATTSTTTTTYTPTTTTSTTTNTTTTIIQPILKCESDCNKLGY